MGSLKYIFVESIKDAFQEGRSKYDERNNPNIDTREHVYSYSQRENLKDTACSFAKFCKVEGVSGSNKNKLKQLEKRTDLASKFLAEKQSQGCSQRTLKRYKSELAKLGVLVSNRYGRTIKFEGRVETKNSLHSDEEKVRTVAVSDKDYQRFLASKKDCQSLMAVKLSRAFGLRVSEAVKLRPCDIDKTKGTIQIVQSKGGRDRTLSIRTEDQKEALRDLEKYTPTTATERYLNVREDSVNRYLNRGFQSLGINTYSMHKTGCHALRKAYATERYQELRSQGDSHQTAWDKVSEELGHGHGREDLFKVYVVKD